MKDTRLDDLQCNNLKILQYTDGYCFSSDAILLANSVRCNSGDTIVDFGCGNGVISLLLTAKTPCKEVIGIEFQRDVADLAQKNVELNSLTGKVRIICDVFPTRRLSSAKKAYRSLCAIRRIFLRLAAYNAKKTNRAFPSRKHLRLRGHYQKRGGDTAICR